MQLPGSFLLFTIVPIFSTSFVLILNTLFSDGNGLPQDPNPFHIYHKELWKVYYRNHLYRICNRFVLPVYYSIFNKHAPRVSEEETIDLTTVGSWFGEEKFTYVRLFGSLTNPNVLSLYVPNKVLARELAY